MADAPLGYLSGPPTGAPVPQYESGPVPSTPEGGEPEATCRVCGGPLWEVSPGRWDHDDEAGVLHVGEPEGCAHVVSYGSRNPDSPRFGPDEYCEEYAVYGSDFCKDHGE